jgi:alkyl hydroperoxide reductase subunit AhpF
MALINERDRAMIVKQFDENLVNPVQMIFFTIPTSKLFVPGRPGCETCNDVQQLLQEIEGTSDKLSLETHNLDQEPEVARLYGVSRVPALVLTGHQGGAVRYFGAPAGYEFTTLLQDIQQISKSETALSAETREALETIEEPIHIQVFVTPT